jgi:hypothetical protein
MRIPVSVSDLERTGSTISTGQRAATTESPQDTCDQLSARQEKSEDGRFPRLMQPAMTEYVVCTDPARDCCDVSEFRRA